MSNAKPVYVSSSGTLGTQPIISRVSNQASNYASLLYLFVETLISPIINPASWTDPSIRSSNISGNTNTGRGGPSGHGGNGGGGPGSGGGPSGGGGGAGGTGGRGFMTMGDLRGGGTVDSCRATCG
ncbi:uncharacterized protein IL334_001480 [Kwoniella shivajii]|uniref:Uncharacterized protein n=1 Tax=Kwoniella shivajii TaxID=564305 RepID=A0ABZ1CS81_9TREE|nr:hypothetical protein IL334_001480 [Kwoniella shivajii]